MHRVVGANLFGAIWFARRAAQPMPTTRGATGSAIVTVSSTAATLGSPHDYIHHAAAKAGVDALTIGPAKELADQGVRVNAVAPGIVDTGIHAAAGHPDRLTRVLPPHPRRPRRPPRSDRPRHHLAPRTPGQPRPRRRPPHRRRPLTGAPTAAATQLQHTHSAVSHQAAALKRDAGAAPVERRPSGIRVTPRNSCCFATPAPSPTTSTPQPTSSPAASAAASAPRRGPGWWCGGVGGCHAARGGRFRGQGRAGRGQLGGAEELGGPGGWEVGRAGLWTSTGRAGRPAGPRDRRPGPARTGRRCTPRAGTVRSATAHGRRSSRRSGSCRGPARTPGSG